MKHVHFFRFLEGLSGSSSKHAQSSHVDDDDDDDDEVRYPTARCRGLRDTPKIPIAFDEPAGGQASVSLIEIIGVGC